MDPCLLCGGQKGPEVYFGPLVGPWGYFEFMGTPSKKHLFSDTEAKLLILLACERESTQEEAYRFFQSCERMRAAELVLKAILSGGLIVTGFDEKSGEGILLRRSGEVPLAIQELIDQL